MKLDQVLKRFTPGWKVAVKSMTIIQLPPNNCKVMKALTSTSKPGADEPIGRLAIVSMLAMRMFNKPR